jgi:hypothetical protein
MAVVKLQMVYIAHTSTGTTCGERMEILDIVSRKSQMPQATSLADSCHIRLASGKTKSNMYTMSHLLNAVPNGLSSNQSMPVKPMCRYLSILPP